ncbi:YdeI/OmpD-associated family protein [Patescibacteria group bacterium]|nr:YdeI/OmpD-associated family protein [Patescibacteria group bacterium]
MAKKVIAGGTAHALPPDLRKALTADSRALAAWGSLTPLARNEWICWTVSVKKSETRREHVERVCAELKEGMRRPCCWIGCIHRTDKAISRSVRGILNARA